MTSPFSPEQLRDVLSSLLSRGGDYGEVFVEKRRAQALGMDDGRMEDVLSSETFGASLRILEGETTRFADLIAPTFEELQEAAPTLAAPGSGAAAAVPALTLQVLPDPQPHRAGSGRGPLLRKGGSGPPGRGTGPGPRRSPQARRHQAGGRGLWRLHPERLDRRGRSHGRRLEGVASPRIIAPRGSCALNVTAGDGRCAPDRLPGPGRDPWVRAVHRGSRGPHRPGGRPPGHPGPGRPSPPRPGPSPSSSRSSAGGTMIHEACGHGLEADLALAGMSAFSGKLGPEGGRGGRDDHRRRHPAPQARLQCLRRRGPARGAGGAHRERHPEGLSAVPEDRAAHGRAAHRQRPPRELPPPAHPPDAQHLPGRRASKPRKPFSRTWTGACWSSTWAAARWTR